MDHVIHAALPHRPPFLFLSEVIQLTPRESGKAVWRLTGDEPFFGGHFPGHPVVPGLLISEALAQLSGLVGWSGERYHTASSTGQRSSIGITLAFVEVRFKHAVTPPATIDLHSRQTDVVGVIRSFDVRATWKEKPVAQGRLMLADTKDR